MANSQAFESTRKYGREQAYGEKWQQWQYDSDDKSCPILRARLTINMLKFFCGWTIDEGDDIFGSPEFMYPPPPRLWPVMVELNLPIDKRYKAVTIKQTVRKVVYGSLKSNEHLVVNDYFLQTGPGVILSEQSTFTWMALSEDLRYVFRVDVVNSVTVRTVLRVYEMNDKKWPEPLCWKYGTPEYQALLSTPNARGVAALVIGGFESGTKFISEICTWADPENYCLQMLFVISNPDLL
ncbi:hypothetical protein N7478_001122 [Penicillium angulare]|uniref:uncharacterized protein n=1 Tax=Penicillium angulare TaxID=116970 RepID=UPI002540F7F8|nr:uncharacterized protein N7478_001122 [Penicillium angulare]KAJ5291871.1 hypothetical protein N7478_001122 [Penicillium angulare]